MNSGSIASRYAKGLFEFCQEKNELESIYPFIYHLRKTLLKESKPIELLEDITLSADEKIGLIERVSGSTLPKTLKQFIGLIIKRNRANILLNAFLIFRRIYLHSKNILDVELLVAEELPPSALEKIKAKVAKTLNSACEIDIKVKPELIAGYILIVNGKVFDSSVKGQLSSVKKKLLEKKFDNR
ncbi:MAG TPA: ATP synthase F1 subunit delta [Bacteroidales bacterium]|nr:ATP synthase F1 subunit delta [Bacteroidales bacterium]